MLPQTQTGNPRLLGAQAPDLLSEYIPSKASLLPLNTTNMLITPHLDLPWIFLLDQTLVYLSPPNPNREYLSKDQRRRRGVWSPAPSSSLSAEALAKEGFPSRPEGCLTLGSWHDALASSPLLWREAYSHTQWSLWIASGTICHKNVGQLPWGGPSAGHWPLPTCPRKCL